MTDHILDWYRKRCHTLAKALVKIRGMTPDPFIRKLIDDLSVESGWDPETRGFREP